MITYADSSLNLLNAVGVHQAGPPKEDSEQPEAVFGVTKEGPLGEVDIIEFNDILIVNENLINKEEVEVYLKEVTSHITEEGNMAFVHNHGEIHLDYFKLGQRNVLSDKQLRLDLKYDFNMGCCAFGQRKRRHRKSGCAKRCY